MKIYKLKTLPLDKVQDDAYNLKQRIEHIEAIINQLGIQFAENENDSDTKLNESVKHLFDEVKEVS